MDIVGFADIKNEDKTCKGAETPRDFIGKTCPVMEFDADGGALVLNPKGTALAMFDKQDIYRSFKRRCGMNSADVELFNLHTTPNRHYL